ncbi:hypothetical protein RHSIM_Rhsim02G0096000 [Rhododendron simsii]|uniref:DOMON domain-containing protein n=1 Tax=Rhododendron simsii TaxID=118357 RepID=A0A834H9F1_RHOSS|nr:hypothetical protein RHSIM_Rhsim02G0096000 [Rhododendron simsii]
MARQKLVFLFCLPVITCFLVLSLAHSTTSAQGSLCSDFVFPNDKVFASCTVLPCLDSFLHWTHNPSSSTLHIAYRHTQVSPSTWVAWGINPISIGMIGTQAIVAYPKPDGTMVVFTSPISHYEIQLREGNLSFPVSDLSASYFNNEMILFVVIELPENTTSVNHVWQHGPVFGSNLGMHQVSRNHLQSMGALDLSSGQDSTSAQVSLCSDFVFPNNRVFASCTVLPYLDSFLHWTHNASSSTLHIAYRHTQVSSSTWVAWGINPFSIGMIGTQAIVAYPKPDGTVVVFTSPISRYEIQLREGNLSFPVSDLSASYFNNEMLIFVVIELPENTTSVNHVWQHGPVFGSNLGMHQVARNHLQSIGALDLSSGQASTSTQGSSCSDFVFPNDKVFASCTVLPYLDSFLHWTHNASSSTLHIAYRHTQVSSSTWVAWGINPISIGMIGTQAIVAYPKPDGTVVVFTSPISRYGTQLREGNLSFPVSDLSASYFDNEMIIFVVTELPKNTTSVNHVWQHGPVSGSNLGMHQVSRNHLQSMGTLDLSSGQASTSDEGRFFERN